ncbi:Type IV pilus biogenesis protein PilQ [hydrothermal vent metagenome]|uniref:Type IV pilus biogenesis protein PilQ n=1 Tax=hydrothermal vent metagenome TaxID=652676 RepID=A0A3B1CKX7_9ZZZZ
MNTKIFRMSWPVLAVTFFLVAQGAFSAESVSAEVVTNESEIIQLTTEEDSGGETIITLESSRAIQYTAFKLLNPLRLVLDFPKMGKGSLTDQVEINKGVVESIRAIRFEEAGVLRLEISLNKAAGYDIQKPVNNQLVIHLKETPVQASRPSMDKMGQSRKMTRRNQSSAEKKQKVIEELAEIGIDPCESLLGGEKEKISLDFQDANVRNLFRIFSEISGFNLILSPEVAGEVNMRLLDVPWNEALEVILKNSGLGRQCLGKNIIRVASLQTLALEEEQKVEGNIRKRDKEVSEKLAAELVTEVVRIDYANIKEVAINLETIKSERGKITVDSRTNTLILTDIDGNLDDMVKLVRVIDVQTPQVMIEARIVEVNKNVSQQLGVQWGTTFTGFNGNTTIAPPTGANSPFLVDLLPGGTVLGAGATSGLALGVDGLIDGLNLDLQLTALEKKGDARILSSPKVTTLDNKEARIESGRSIPFQTTSANQGTKIEFVDAELSLKVTPHITSDDYVYMVIDATKNAANLAVKVNGFPEITTKEAHTEVLVKNGDTTVLGGIYESEVRRNKESVPVLSKIPILGALFRNMDEADDVKELLIFVTPTILTNTYSKMQ